MVSVVWLVRWHVVVLTRVTVVGGVGGVKREEELRAKRVVKETKFEMQNFRLPC